MEYKILIVEDNKQICEMISDYFTSGKEESFRIEAVHDGRMAEEILDGGNFDLILLDIMLPGTDGFTLLKRIRKTNDVPVIILTARTLEEDVLKGYGLGCDDYVTKPFSLATLYAKCIAVLNRSRGTVVSKEIRIGAIRINPETGVVTSGGQSVKLSPKEFELLSYLALHKDKVISRETLLDAVWGDEFEGFDRTVDNHIKKLRQSLGENGRQIVTVFSRGYKMTE
jgi:DNA-binding response OmpR family regulator